MQLHDMEAELEKLMTTVLVVRTQATTSDAEYKKLKAC